MSKSIYVVTITMYNLGKLNYNYYTKYMLYFCQHSKEHPQYNDHDVIKDAVTFLSYVISLKLFHIFNTKNVCLCGQICIVISQWPFLTFQIPIRYDSDTFFHDWSVLLCYDFIGCGNPWPKSRQQNKDQLSSGPAALITVIKCANQSAILCFRTSAGPA